MFINLKKISRLILQPLFKDVEENDFVFVALIMHDSKKTLAGSFVSPLSKMMKRIILISTR